MSYKTQLPLKNINNFLKLENVGDEILERKSFTAKQFTIGAEEDRTFIGVMSNDSIDADGDIIYCPGCDLTRFYNNSIVCWNHQYSEAPVGKVLEVKVEGNTLIGKIKMASTEFATELWELIKGGFLKCQSIGFIVNEVLIAGTAKFKQFALEHNLNVEGCKRIVTKFTLVENSLVPLPSNQEALILAYSTKSLKLDDKLAKQLGIEVKNIIDINEAPKVEAKVEEVVPIVPVVETPKVEEVKVEPKVEVPIEEPKFTVIRVGEYVISEDDKKISKSLKNGRII